MSIGGLTAGIPTPANSDHKRIWQLEQDVRDLQLALRQTMIPAQHIHSPTIRIARTVDDGNYPPSSGGPGYIVVPIEFLDVTFTNNNGFATPLRMQSRKSSADTFTVRALMIGEDQYIEPETVVAVIWQRPPSGLATADTDGEWFIVSAASNGGGAVEYPIFHARLTSQLNPGGSATAVLVDQTPGGTGDFINSATAVTVWDNYDKYSATPGQGTPFGQNFGLVGEMIKARWNVNTEIYEVVGSQGLLRRGLVDSNIAADSEGPVSLYGSTATADCDGSDTTVNITACAGFRVSAQTEVFVHWQPEFKKWAIIAVASGFRDIFFGKPNSSHASGTAVTYSRYQLDTGPTTSDTTEDVSGVYQASGFAYSDQVWALCWEVDTDDPALRYWSFPVEFLDCEETDDAAHGVPVDSILITPSGTLTNSNESVGIGEDVSLTNSDSSVVIGFMASSSNDFNTIIGAEATAVGDTVVSMGYQASANAREVAIGYQASGYRDGVAIGYQATTTAFSSIAIGRESDDNGNQGVIILGRAITATQSETMYIGSADFPINDVFFNGTSVASPDVIEDVVIHGAGVAAGDTDTDGGDLTLASGQSTGTGSSFLRFQTPTKSLSTGTAVNSLIEAKRVTAFELTTINSTQVDVPIFTTSTDRGYLVNIEVLAVNTDDYSQVNGYHRRAVLKNDGGTLTRQGASPQATYTEEDDGSWNAQINVDNTAKTAIVEIIGDATATVKWKVVATIIEGG